MCRSPTQPELPFPDKSFDVVISVNTVHNLNASECAQALREIERVARRGAFVTVDAYRDESRAAPHGSVEPDGPRP